MTFFKHKDNIRVVFMHDWLDWACGNKNEYFLALPMIQRGSVWNPEQIINLWDSLLRGMPIGAMMAHEVPVGSPILPMYASQKSNQYEKANKEFLALLDGQQRTLAMLAAWSLPADFPINQRIWLDLTDEPAPNQLFRMHVTTRNQPFGFQRNAPSTRLSVSDRRKAIDACTSYSEKTNFEEVLNSAWDRHAMPYSAKNGSPLELGKIINSWNNNYLQKQKDKNSKKDTTIDNFKHELIDKLGGGVSDENREIIEHRAKTLAISIWHLFDIQIPVIRVDDSLFEVSDKNMHQGDPPLAILFKRIGSGGTQLSNADYIYSIIKHMQPETYNLVEGLLRQQNVASLLSATDLVMSTVRLSAINWKDNNNNKITDKESLDKKQFQSLLSQGKFIEDAFLPLIMSTNKTNDSSESLIASYFTNIHKALLYDKSSNPYGLPKQMFTELKRPLVQVLLRLAQVGHLSNDIKDECRFDILRLVLFWIVAVPNKNKPKASQLAYKAIDEVRKHDSKKIYGRAIHDQLVDHKLTNHLISPEKIKEIGLNETKEPTTLLGMTRFYTNEDDSNNNKYIYDSYYKHWWRSWTYHHPILLWLQREMVARDFKYFDPMSGRGEDTPYDYDHILPRAHWGKWTGSTIGKRLLDFSIDNNVWVEGNAIGNVCILSMGDNRSFGDTPPIKKLKLNESHKKYTPVLKDSAIADNQIDDWKNTSSKDDKYKIWDKDRAIAFQRVVERRTFALYEDFYDKMKFDEWIPK